MTTGLYREHSTYGASPQTLLHLCGEHKQVEERTSTNGHAQRLPCERLRTNGVAFTVAAERIVGHPDKGHVSLISKANTLAPPF